MCNLEPDKRFAGAWHARQQDKVPAALGARPLRESDHLIDGCVNACTLRALDEGEAQVIEKQSRGSDKRRQWRVLGSQESGKIDGWERGFAAKLNQ